MSASEPCPKCDLYHPDPGEPYGRRCYFDDLIDALSGVDLDKADRRLIRWLAKAEFGTVDQLVALIKKIRAVQVLPSRAEGELRDLARDLVSNGAPFEADRLNRIADHYSGVRPFRVPPSPGGSSGASS